MEDNLITWQGYEWWTRERWGRVHHEKPHWWYDPSVVNIDSKGNLHLSTHKNPKTVDGIASTIGVGLVSCTTKFGHGTFTIEAKLPRGANLWPAFWMWSWDTWPPEIDVFEAYSDHKGSYFKLDWSNPIGFWNVQTNLHYTDTTNKVIGPETHWMGIKNPTRHFCKYSVTWLPDRVEYWFNDRMVRCITDPYIINQLNKTKMNVVINNGVTADVDLTNPPVSNFIIQSFTYTPAK